MQYVITLQHRRFLMTVSINGSFLKIAVLKIGTLCLQRTYNFIHSEAVVQRCSVKKVFLKISQNSQENTGARVFFNKVAVLGQQVAASVNIWYMSQGFCWHFPKNPFKIFRTLLVFQRKTLNILNLFCVKNKYFLQSLLYQAY